MYYLKSIQLLKMMKALQDKVMEGLLQYLRGVLNKTIIIER
jgi:hypothetical protein